MLHKKKKKKNVPLSTYLDVKKAYLNQSNNDGVQTTTPPNLPTSPMHEGASSDEGMSDLRLRASEKRDILLYYILENFYTIDEVHKNKLYAFLLKLTELQAIDFDPFAQPGLYPHFRKQLGQVMHDLHSKGAVLPLLQGIHSSNYNYNMVSRAAIDFETICFLGKGGFGEVFKVRNRIDGNVYALKTVKFRDLPNSAKNLDKVLREVKALAQLGHENVLRYYNAWIEVEHAGEYTKKLLESVSYTKSPTTSPVLISRLQQAVGNSDRGEDQAGNDEQSSSEEEEEDSREIDSGDESSDSMPVIGQMFGYAYATSSTDEAGEGMDENEDSSQSETSSGSAGFVGSEESIYGVNIMRRSKSWGDSASSDSSDIHSITSIHSANSSSSSHSNIHGINLPAKTELGGKGVLRRSGGVVNSLRTSASKVFCPLDTEKGSANARRASGLQGARTRNNLDTMLNSFRRGHESILRKSNEFLKGGKDSEDESDEDSTDEGEEGQRGKRGKGRSDESDEWEHHSMGTSASKSFMSREISNEVKALVPFIGPIAPPSPPRPPKNRYVLYIQMQLCEARTLKSVLDRPDRHISVVENMNTFSQIVNGLHHIHSRGLIHRDLKPDNIFFTTEGTVKIGDFGLSKQFGDGPAQDCFIFEEDPMGSPHTMGIGTKSYASPEQIRSNFYTTKSDIYSLGIILFEMFNIFNTATERAKAFQDLRQGIIPTSMWSKYPDVARFVLCLMDEEPENRPSTDEILRSTFVTLSKLSQDTCSIVLKQQQEIERLQEKIMRLEQELKLSHELKNS